MFWGVENEPKSGKVSSYLTSSVSEQFKGEVGSDLNALEIMLNIFACV